MPSENKANFRWERGSGQHSLKWLHDLSDKMFSSSGDEIV